jgi:small subunit ribosomal protein S6
LATPQETAYEAVFIIDASQPDEQVNATVEKYKGVITHQGGTVDDEDRWDPRRLAYEIKRRREGIYIVANFTGTAAVKDELSRIFHISDDVLRHIIVKQHPQADRFPSRIRAAEQQREQERRERDAAARAAAAPAVPPAEEPVTDLSAATDTEGVSTENAPVNEAEATDAVEATESEATDAVEATTDVAEATEGEATPAPEPETSTETEGEA